MKKIVIVGAGISGLSVGWYLKKRFQEKIELLFIEKTNTIGGWIQSRKEKDFLFELGPRGFRPSGKGQTTLELISSLGIRNKLISADSSAKKRFIYRKGRLEKATLFYFLKNGGASFFFKDWFAKKCAYTDETIFDFFSRRANNTFLNHLIDPVVLGIFAGDIHTLSMRSCFPTLWQAEEKHSSLIKAFIKGKKTANKNPTAALMSFEEGMQTLPEAIYKELDARFHFQKSLCAVVKKEKSVLLKITKEEIHADHVIFAISDEEIRKILNLEKTAQNRKSIVMVNVGWKELVFPVKGFGFLAPTTENFPLLGMTFDSEIFPKQNNGSQIRLSAMMKKNKKEQDYESIALNCIKKLFQIHKKPDFLSLHIHEKAIPQYDVGHFERLEELKKMLPSYMHVLGMSFNGIGVNDCIENARLLADQFCL